MTKKAKATGPTPAELEKQNAEAALDSANRAIVIDLLQGKTSSADIARVIYEHPRYERAILAFVQSVGSNSSVNGVFDELDKLESANNAPADHVEDVASRGKLTGNATPVAETDTTSGGNRLPYDGRGGWDAVEINKQLGQLDNLAGTDNDGWRCGFATVLASKVFQGPASFTNWLRAFRSQNGPAGDRLTPIQQGARDVMEAVEKAILAGTATFRDLSWLMEALYDFAVTAKNEAHKDDPFYKEQKGVLATSEVYSPATDTLDKNAAKGEYTEPAGVVTAAKGLQPGANIMVEWHTTKAKDGAALDHEMMISNHQGTLYIYDSLAPAGLNLRPLTTENLKPYFNETNYKSTKMTLAGTLTPVVPK